MENRMEILVLELQILEDWDAIALRKNAILPSINFDYRYNVNAFGAKRRNSFDMLESNQFADHYFGLSAQIPVGNRAAKSRLNQARLQRFQRLSTKRNREALITLEVLNAGEQLEANWQRILASRQNVVVSGRLYEAERRQFNLELRTSTEVFDAQTNLANAQLSELSALAEYQISLVDLAYATGTLLGSANVEWEPLKPSLN
jgi:outer membrane protein TolC